MRIYGIGGLGADHRVFQFLDLEGEFIFLDWLEPGFREPIAHYAERMVQRIDQTRPFVLMGVSFGGLVAVEMSKILHPDLTILIASVSTYQELRPVYRFLGKTGVHRILPTKLFILAQPFLNYLFGARNKELLREIISDTDPVFMKWALDQLVRWSSRVSISPILKISGTSDKLMPPVKDENTILVRGGEHFMIADRAGEISHIINESIRPFRIHDR